MARVTGQRGRFIGYPAAHWHMECLSSLDGAEGLLHLHLSPGARPAATSAKVAEDLSSPAGVNSP